MATLGAALFAAAVVLFVVGPLLTGREARVERTADELTDADAWKWVTLRALRDVEYDYHTGKLDDHDYEVLKNELTIEAAQALRRADAEAADEISEGVGGAAVEAEIMKMRAILREATNCPACNHANPPGSRFCAACGVAVAS